MFLNFAFMRTELESGWFAIKKEPDDKDDYGKKQLTKVSVQEADYSIGYLTIIPWARWLWDGK